MQVHTYFDLTEADLAEVVLPEIELPEISETRGALSLTRREKKALKQRKKALLASSKDSRDLINCPVCGKRIQREEQTVHNRIGHLGTKTRSGRPWLLFTGIVESSRRRH